MKIGKRYVDVFEKAAFQADRIEMAVQRLWSDSQYKLEQNKQVVANVLALVIPNPVRQMEDDDTSLTLVSACSHLKLAESWGWKKYERAARLRSLMLGAALLDAQLLRELPTGAAQGLRLRSCQEYSMNLAARARCSIRRAAWPDAKLTKWLKRVASAALSKKAVA